MQTSTVGTFFLLLPAQSEPEEQNLPCALCCFVRAHSRYDGSERVSAVAVCARVSRWMDGGKESLMSSNK